MIAARDVLSSLLLDDGSPWIDKAADWQVSDALAVLDAPEPFHFITRPRGGSKTTDLGGIGLAWLLSADDALKFYAVAADKDQARLLLDSMASFARRSQSISDLVTVDTWKITAPRSGATLEVLAADAASSWGIRPAGIIIDELAWWSDSTSSTVLLDSLLSSASKMAGARVAVITSPSSPSHFAHKLREHAAEDALWRLSETPGPVPWLSEARIESERRRLSDTMFRRVFLGEWVEADDLLTDNEALREAIAHDGPLDPRPGVRYWIGLDLGLKRDRTVAAIAHLDGERIVLDRLGVWKGSRVHPVRLGDVEDWVEQASRAYNGARLIADPWQSVGLLQRLRDRGIHAEEFTFSTQSVGKLAGALFNLLRDRRLALIDDADLIDELAHVRLRESSPGVFRLDHDSGRHDDRAIALALVAHRLLTEPKVGNAMSLPSPWEDPGRFKAWEQAQKAKVARRPNAFVPTSPPPPERVGKYRIRHR